MKKSLFVFAVVSMTLAIGSAASLAADGVDQRSMQATAKVDDATKKIMAEANLKDKIARETAEKGTNATTIAELGKEVAGRNTEIGKQNGLLKTAKDDVAKAANKDPFDSAVLDEAKGRLDAALQAIAALKGANDAAGIRIEELKKANTTLEKSISADGKALPNFSAAATQAQKDLPQLLQEEKFAQDLVQRFESQKGVNTEVANLRRELDQLKRDLADPTKSPAAKFAEEAKGYRNEAQGFRNEAAGFAKSAMGFRDECKQMLENPNLSKEAKDRWRAALEIKDVKITAAVQTGDPTRIERVKKELDGLRTEMRNALEGKENKADWKSGTLIRTDCGGTTRKNVRYKED